MDFKRQENGVIFSAAVCTSVSLLSITGGHSLANLNRIEDTWSCIELIMSSFKIIFRQTL